MTLHPTLTMMLSIGLIIPMRLRVLSGRTVSDLYLSGTLVMTVKQAEPNHKHSPSISSSLPRPAELQTKRAYHQWLRNNKDTIVVETVWYLSSIILVILFLDPHSLALTCRSRRHGLAARGFTPDSWLPCQQKRVDLG